MLAIQVFFKGLKRNLRIVLGDFRFLLLALQDVLIQSPMIKLFDLVVNDRR